MYNSRIGGENTGSLINKSIFDRLKLVRSQNKNYEEV
jgi:hypothetical protein